MSKSLKIEEWLEKSGFPLELKVARLFSKYNFAVGQSISYQDLNTEKVRDTDVLAYKTQEFNGVWVNLAFVVECKKSVDKPWIAFMNDQVMNLTKDSFPILATRNGGKLLKEIKTKSDFRSPLIFPNHSRVGYSITRAFGDGKDMAYSAIQSTLSASDFFISKSNSSRKRFMNFYLPMVVVEGGLYEASLGKKDEIDLKEVTETKISVTKSFSNESSSIISILTFANLESLLRQINNNCIEFFSKYSKELDSISSKYPTNTFVF